LFTQLFYLIIVLLIISFAPQYPNHSLTSSPLIALLLGSVTYIITLTLIAVQNILFSKWLRTSRNLLLGGTNLLLIVFLLAWHFVFVPQSALPPSSLLVTLLSLSLYFGGLYTYYLTAYPRIPAGSRGLVGSANAYAINHIRFILPFCIPFLLLTCLIDAVTFLPSEEAQQWLVQQLESRTGFAFFIAALFLFLILILLFYPPLTIRIWKCRDLPASELRGRLEKLCKKAGFQYGGMKTWTILNHSYTAAIVGILPRFRYVMFTRRLLDELSPRSIIAILSHEIGHSARRHLLLYPAIIFGMLILFGLVSQLFGPAFDAWFAKNAQLYPSPIWEAVYPVALLMIYAISFLIYLRVVFGYFSRLFERQADLHVYEMDIPPDDMQLALDEIGHVTGGTHQIPCWHHHSIQKRIDFLEATKQDPSLIGKHHRRVRRSLILYFLLLGIGIYFTYAG